MYELTDEALNELEQLFSRLAGFYLHHKKRTNNERRFCETGCGGGAQNSDGKYAQGRTGNRMAGPAISDVCRILSRRTGPQMAEAIQAGPLMEKAEVLK